MSDRATCQPVTAIVTEGESACETARGSFASLPESKKIDFNQAEYLCVLDTSSDSIQILYVSFLRCFNSAPSL